jgi:hypothetical protein
LSSPAQLTADPLIVSIAYNASAEHGLPPSVTDPHLSTFKITGIEKIFNT